MHRCGPAIAGLRCDWIALALGSRGGHGPIRYHVTSYAPGAEVRFTMGPGQGFTGWHRLAIERGDRPDTVRWTHELVLDQVGPLVRAVVVPLHDQLIEDLLDAATAEMAGVPLRRDPLPLKVTMLLAVMDRLQRSTGSGGRGAADAATVALLAIGALHTVWATGSAWPARSRAELADCVLSRATTVPGPAACLSVGIGLASAAALVQARTRAAGPLAGLPSGMVDLGVDVAGGVLALRGLGGLATSTFGGRGGRRYRRLDLLLYSPLCLALATVLLATGRQRSDR